jgi:outer membrane protein OmpA-like peptidoglycan-associated protein
MSGERMGASTLSRAVQSVDMDQDLSTSAGALWLHRLNKETGMRHRDSVIAAVLFAVLAGGCATERQTQTAVGTGVGAAAGAAVGGAAAGTRGAVVGAAVGGGVGALVGYNWPAVKEKLGLATRGTSLNLTEQQDGALMVSVPGAVAFTSGSAVLSQQVRPDLDKVAATLVEHSDTTVNVVGHADSSGNAAANRELARRRAQAVADYLADRGVSRTRMRVESRGDLAPIADNRTEAGRAQNRRVELVIRPIES